MVMFGGHRYVYKMTVKQSYLIFSFSSTPLGNTYLILAFPKFRRFGDCSYIDGAPFVCENRTNLASIRDYGLRSPIAHFMEYVFRIYCGERHADLILNSKLLD